MTIVRTKVHNIFILLMLILWSSQAQGMTPDSVKILLSRANKMELLSVRTAKLQTMIVLLSKEIGKERSVEHHQKELKADIKEFKTHIAFFAERIPQFGSPGHEFSLVQNLWSIYEKKFKQIPTDDVLVDVLEGHAQMLDACRIFRIKLGKYCLERPGISPRFKSISNIARLSFEANVSSQRFAYICLLSHVIKSKKISGIDDAKAMTIEKTKEEIYQRLEYGVSTIGNVNEASELEIRFKGLQKYHLSLMEKLKNESGSSEFNTEEVHYALQKMESRIEELLSEIAVLSNTNTQ